MHSLKLNTYLNVLLDISSFEVTFTADEQLVYSKHGLQIRSYAVPDYKSGPTGYQPYITFSISAKPWAIVAGATLGTAGAISYFWYIGLLAL